MYGDPEHSDFDNDADAHANGDTMRKLALALLLLASPAWADISIRNPSTCASDAAIGTEAWENPGNAISSNDLRATSGLANGELSNYILCTDYDFDDAAGAGESGDAIPIGATINSVTLHWEKDATNANNVVDGSVRLYSDNGVIEGTDQLDATTKWATSDAVISYNGDSNGATNWDENFCSATASGDCSNAAHLNVLHDSFGAVVAAQDSTDFGAGDSSPVDLVQLEIDWTSADTPTPSPVSTATRTPTRTVTPTSTPTSTPTLVCVGLREQFSIVADDEDGEVVVIDTASGWPPAGLPSLVLVSNNNEAHKSDGGSSTVASNILWSFNTASLPNQVIPSFGFIYFETAGVTNTDGKSLTGDYFDWRGNDPNDVYSFAAQTGAITPRGLSTFASIGRDHVDLASFSGINTSGYTQLRLHISDDSAPTGINVFRVEGYGTIDPPEDYFKPVLELCYVTPTATPTVTATPTLTPTFTPRLRCVTLTPTP